MKIELTEAKRLLLLELLNTELMKHQPSFHRYCDLRELKEKLES